MPYLTPDHPTGAYTVSLVIPDTFTPAWWGSMLEMVYTCAWEVFGELDVSTVLAYVGAMLDSVQYGSGPIIPPLILQDDTGDVLTDDLGSLIFQG